MKACADFAQICICCVTYSQEYGDRTFCVWTIIMQLKLNVLILLNICAVGRNYCSLFDAILFRSGRRHVG